MIVLGNDIGGSAGEMCRFCGCCSAFDGMPGCVGTTVGGSHDGREWLLFSRFWQFYEPEHQVWMLENECYGWPVLDPLIHSVRVVDRLADTRSDQVKP